MYVCVCMHMCMCVRGSTILIGEMLTMSYALAVHPPFSLFNTFLLSIQILPTLYIKDSYNCLQGSCVLPYPIQLPKKCQLFYIKGVYIYIYIFILFFLIKEICKGTIYILNLS